MCIERADSINAQAHVTGNAQLYQLYEHRPRPVPHCACRVRGCRCPPAAPRPALAARPRAPPQRAVHVCDFARAAFSPRRKKPPRVAPVRSSAPERRHESRRRVATRRRGAERGRWRDRHRRKHGVRRDTCDSIHLYSQLSTVTQKLHQSKELPRRRPFVGEGIMTCVRVQ